MQVSIISIAVNAVLTLFKLFVGIAAQSGAMVSDAVHSGSDVFSTLIVIAGVTVAEKRPDSGHPYGHERMECVASLLLAVILAATGIGIGAAGMKRIAEGGSLSVPGMAALLAARAPATAMEKQEKPVLARSAPCRGSWTAAGEDSRARSSTVGNSMRSGESL